MTKFPIQFLLLGIFIFTSILQAQTLMTIDAAGRDGIDGAAGTDYSGSSAFTSQNGANGGRAGPSTPGENGGNINLSIQEGATQSGVVVIKGSIRESRTKNGQMDQTLNFGHSGYIYIDAKGGTGGDGGVGGGAQRGGTGYSGSNATQYSSGTNGGPGGRGGNGGEGTPASRGGDAGEIRIRVASKDTHLLMLFKSNVKGGSGGSAGRNGSGASGGSGGSGGSSYSWTETVRDGETCTNNCSLTSNGNGSYSNNCTRSCTPNYRTISHSQSGGSSGSSGSSGSDAHADVSAGAAGNNGRYIIEVQQPNGQIAEYKDRFDMHLESFTFKPKQDNGIYEPGETVLVSNIRIRNVGQMPTPDNVDSIIYLNDNRWVLSSSAKIHISKSIMPGDYYNVPQTLEFKISESSIPVQAERFVDKGVIQPLSYLERVNRPFEKFDNNQSFEITFPIEISPIMAPGSMVAGTTSRIFWKIKNISKRDFGVESDLARKIQTYFRLNSDVNSQANGSLKFEGDQEQNKFLKEILKLKSGESVLIEGEIGVSADAPAYSSINTRLDLKIGEIDSKKMKEIQARDFKIRVATTYQYRPGIDMLLITNHETRQDEIMAWNELATQLGLKVAVWDLSYYGFLDLAQVIRKENDEAKALKDDLSKKLIILPNNEFDTGRSKARATEVSSVRSISKSLTESGVSFYIIGGVKEDLKKLMIPPMGKLQNNFSYLGELLKAAESYKKEKKNYFGASHLGNYLNFYDKISQSDWFIFNPTNKPELLQEKAADTIHDLEKKYPGYIFSAVYENNPSKQAGSKLQWSLGDIYLRRLGSAGVGMMVSSLTPDRQIHEPRFILSDDNILNIFMAMRFSQKLEYLTKLLNGQSAIDGVWNKQLFKENSSVDSNEVIKSFMDSIISDISFEHRFVNMLSSNLNGSELKKYLFNLNRLANIKVEKPLALNTPMGRGVTRLLTGLKYMQWSEHSVYENYVWSSSIMSKSEDMLDQLVKSLFAKTEKTSVAAFKSQVKGELTLAKEASRHLYTDQEKWEPEVRKEKRYQQLATPRTAQTNILSRDENLKNRVMPMSVQRRADDFVNKSDMDARELKLYNEQQKALIKPSSGVINHD